MESVSSAAASTVDAAVTRRRCSQTQGGLITSPWHAAPSANSCESSIAWQRKTRTSSDLTLINTSSTRLKWSANSRNATPPYAAPTVRQSLENPNTSQPSGQTVTTRRTTPNSAASSLNGSMKNTFRGRRRREETQNFSLSSFGAAGEASVRNESNRGWGGRERYLSFLPQLSLSTTDPENRPYRF